MVLTHSSSFFFFFFLFLFLLLLRLINILQNTMYIYIYLYVMKWLHHQCNMASYGLRTHWRTKTALQVNTLYSHSVFTYTLTSITNSCPENKVLTNCIQAESETSHFIHGSDCIGCNSLKQNRVFLFRVNFSLSLFFCLYFVVVVVK